MTIQQMKYVIAIAECGSMNEAAKELYLSQPSLSGAMKELEEELSITIFHRSNRGISVTPEGKEFLAYARQVVEQYKLMEDHYMQQKHMKRRFSVSTQHYTFVVQAFSQLIKECGLETYDYTISETRTYEVIEDVKNLRSDIGIIYKNSSNEKVIENLLRENSLMFSELFHCNTYVYLCDSNPLAKKELITKEDLQEYPCLSFDQGSHNSFFLAEESIPVQELNHVIKVNDRATILNLMVAINGYTICSGIICEELNSDGLKAIPYDSEEVMRIGYVIRKDIQLDDITKQFIQELQKCGNHLL